MTIGLFLDVDKTLTTECIQHVYSRAIGCEAEYLKLEEQLQSGQIDDSRFGRAIITLFAGKGFTTTKARELFDRVILQPWAVGLLTLPNVDKYLVSSGPNFYIDLLAEAFGIPPARSRRSVYKFDSTNGLISSCDAVNAELKANFVEPYLAHYEITVGIGDSPQSDGPFVSKCTIPILTCRQPEYVYIPDLKSAALLIRRLQMTIGGHAASQGENDLVALGVRQPATLASH